MSNLVRQKGFCERCGKTEHHLLQHAHVIPRTNLFLRWDIFNALCLCYSCHLFWAHKNPLEFTEWFKNRYPERYAYLMAHKNRTRKWLRQDYEKLFNDIENKNLNNLIYKGY